MRKALWHGHLAASCPCTHGQDAHATFASPDTNVPYRFSYHSSKLSRTEEGDSVRLEELRFALQYKTKRLMNNLVTDAWDDRGFFTNLDVRLGQRVVVGKTNFEVGNSALIAVISAKVVE